MRDSGRRLFWISGGLVVAVLLVLLPVAFAVVIAAGFMPEGTRAAGALGSADRAAADRLAAWRPRTPGAWKQTAPSPPAVSDSLGCALNDGARWATGTAAARLEWVRCDNASQSTFILSTHGAALQRIGSGVLGDADQAYRSADGSISRTWAQGPFALNLITRCPRLSESACVELNADEARAARPLVSEKPEDRTEWVHTFLVTLLISGPIAVWVVTVWPIRFFAWVAEPRYASTDGDARYGDLTGATRRAVVRRVVRRVISVAAGVATVSFTGELIGRNWLGAAIAGVVTAGLVALRIRLRADRRLPRRPGPGLAPRAVAGQALTTGVLIATPVLIATYLFTSLLGFLVSLFAGPRRQEIYLSSHGVRALLVGVGVGVAGAGAGWLLFMLVPAIFLLFLVDRIGRRLSAQTASERTAADRRPPILFLRSFDEDRLKIPSSAARVGLIARLCTLRRRRFEEILVGHLNRYGPVIALSPPGTRFPPIGAARQTLPNDVWQTRIREMAEGALCVVISGTPQAINAGLDFELRMVASELSHQRVLLVVGPWRRDTGRERWRRFVAWTGRYPMFQPIALPFVQPGTHLLAHTPTGWYAWGARRRTDRTYGACVDAALARARAEWAGPESVEQPRPVA